MTNLDRLLEKSKPVINELEKNWDGACTDRDDALKIIVWQKEMLTIAVEALNKIPDFELKGSMALCAIDARNKIEALAAKALGDKVNRFSWVSLKKPGIGSRWIFNYGLTTRKGRRS